MIVGFSPACSWIFWQGAPLSLLLRSAISHISVGDLCGKLAMANFGLECLQLFLITIIVEEPSNSNGLLRFYSTSATSSNTSTKSMSPILSIGIVQTNFR